MSDVNKIIYVDMDGVLADFDSGVEKTTGKRMNYYFNDDDPIWVQIRKHGVERFFSELEWLPYSKDMWNYIYSNFMIVKILSAMGKENERNNGVYRGKHSWLRKNIPNLRESDIILVANKHKKQEYSRPGDIIIDDTEVVITEWNNKGGTGILHKSARETIKILSQYV